MEQDTVYRPYINISKTWANIFRLMKRAKISRTDLSKIFRISPQAVFKKFSPKSLPTIEQLILLSELFEKNIEEILVIDKFEEKDKEYKKLFSKAHSENELALKIIESHVSDEELYDERLDNLEYELNYDNNYFYKYINPLEYHIYMCANEISLFQDGLGCNINDGKEIGKIYLHEYDKYYDLTVSGLKEWYNEYLENWEKDKSKFKENFDIIKWNKKAIELIKDMYKILPQNIFISYSTPVIIGHDNLNYQGNYLVPKD